ncbi:MAG: hemolysin family protein [Chloroflexota bacterium]
MNDAHGALDLNTIALRMLAVAALVAANAFFTVAEFALVNLRRSQIEQLAEHSAWGRMLLRAKDHPDSFISAAQLGITMASLGLGWIGESTVAALVDPLLSALFGESRSVAVHSISIGISFALITTLHIVLGEQVPKMTALRFSERAGLLTVGPMGVFFRVFRPFIWLLTLLTDLALRGLRIPKLSEHGDAVSSDELELMVQTSHRAGALEDAERELLTNVFDFADLVVHQVMVPRPEIVAVPIDVTRDDLLDLGQRSPHTRFPVYEGTLDNVAGLVHIKDLMHVARTTSDGLDLRALLRPALFVPETMPAGRLLSEFKRAHTTLAIVVDEYGGTAGVVTIDDLVEEIVGDVPDELHPETPLVCPQSDGTTTVSGRLRVDELADHFSIDLGAEPESETVAGLVQERLGRLAEAGDEIPLDGYALRVERVEGVRIVELRMVPSAAEPPLSEKEV